MKLPKLKAGKLSPALHKRYTEVQLKVDRAIEKTTWAISDQHVVVTTKLDLRHFQTLIARYPKVKELTKRAEEDYPAFGSLLQDIYFALYLAQVKLREPKQLAPTFRMNAEIMARVFALDIFTFTRQHSRLNEGKSWIGMVEIAEKVLDGLPEDMKEQAREQARQQAKSEQERQELEDLMHALDKMANPPEEEQPAEQEEPGNTPEPSTEPEPDDQAPSAGDQPPVGEDVTPDAEGEGQDPGDGDDGDSEGENEEASPKMPGDSQGSGNGGGSSSGQSDPDGDEADETGDGEPSNDPASTGQADGRGETHLEESATDEAYEQALEELLDEIERQCDEIMSLHVPEISAEDGDRLRRMAKRTLKDTNEKLDTLADAMASWGIEDAEWNEIPIGDRIALADQLSKLANMAEFVKELGRMRHEALNALKTPGAIDRQEVVGIAIGGDVNNVIPEELINLLDPKLSLLFYANLFLEESLEHEYAGLSPSANGPFIILTDVSGSMEGSGDRWAKAFMIAAIEIAKKRTRDVAIIFFDTKIQHMMTIPGGRATAEDKLAIAKGFGGGGTSWQPALEAAILNIGDREGTWKTADVVLVTDGICQLNPEFRDLYVSRARELSVRTHCVLIDNTPYSLHSIESFCDQVYLVSSLAGSREAAPIFQKLALTRS